MNANTLLKAITVGLVIVNLVPILWHMINPDRPVGIDFEVLQPRGDMSQPIAYISGAVVRPGVYEFKEGDRIADLLLKAGGFSGIADSSAISERVNLSQILKDEQQVFIPGYSEGGIIEPVANDQVDINTATLSELTKMPGIGESTAQNLIAARPFNSVSELLDVPGIGNAKYEALKSYFRVN
jgi:competence protein ComEA